MIISAVKQTNERQKNRSGDGGKGFSEEVTFSVPWQVLGEEHFWQEIVWCVFTELKTDQCGWSTASD